MEKCHICQKEIQEDSAVRLGWKNDPNPTFICRECAKHLNNAISQSIEEERKFINLIKKQMETIVAVPKH